jgi:PAS domain S-box-containing protein
MGNIIPLDESELKAQEKVTPQIKESEDHNPDENERLEKLVRERTEALETELEERRKAEKSLNETNQKYAEAQRIAHIGNWEHCLLTGELQFSDEMYHIFGINPGTTLNLKEVTKSYDPKELVRFHHAVKEAIEENKQYSIDYKIIRPNGQVRYIHNEGEPVRDENGKPIRMVGTSHDITDRKRIELIQKVLYAISHAVITTKDVEELSGVIKEQLGQLLDTTNFFIAAYDEETDMLSSQYFADQKDSFSSWPAGKSLTGYVVKKDRSLIVTKVEISNMAKSGEIHQIGSPAEVWLGVPLHEDGKVIGAFVLQNYDDVNAYTAKDVELLEFISHQISISIQRKKGLQDLVKALAKAEESDHLKTAFLSNMSHEIRTPMNGILGFSELLDDNTLSQDDRRTFLDIINSNGQHLLSIINDILDIAKIDSNQLIINKTPLNLHQLLDELLVSYQNNKIAIGKEHLTLLLEKEFEDNNCTIICDEVRLRQILYNLLGNALKFTKTGYIKFGYTLIGEELRFYVQDTGKGISKDKQSLVFERFRQEEESYTRQFGGTGLGLSISKKLVELLGGEMWMVSEQGIGTTFYFTIPFAQLPLKDENCDKN